VTFGPATYDCSLIAPLLADPAHAAATASLLSGGCEWSDDDLSKLKALLRVKLRKMQEDRCSFCRRKLILERRNVYEDIEHYLDKSKAHYLKWALTPKNLTTACHACNFQKSTKDLGGSFALTALNYPDDPTTYTYVWLHPHFDDYFANIEISKGWTYTVKATAPQKGRAEKMVHDLRLFDIERIEAASEGVKRELEALNLKIRECVRQGDLAGVEEANNEMTRVLEESTFG